MSPGKDIRVIRRHPEWREYQDIGEGLKALVENAKRMSKSEYCNLYEIHIFPAAAPSSVGFHEYNVFQCAEAAVIGMLGAASIAGPSRKYETFAITDIVKWLESLQSLQSLMPDLSNKLVIKFKTTQVDDLLSPKEIGRGIRRIGAQTIEKIKQQARRNIGRDPELRESDMSAQIDYLIHAERKKRSQSQKPQGNYEDRFHPWRPQSVEEGSRRFSTGVLRRRTRSRKKKQSKKKQSKKTRKVSI